MLAGIERQRAIRDITAGIGVDTTINGKIVNALGGEPLRGQLSFTTVDGRLPGAVDEVALGATTMRQVGAHLGSPVRVMLPGAGGTAVHLVVPGGRHGDLPPGLRRRRAGYGRAVHPGGPVGGGMPGWAHATILQVQAVITSKAPFGGGAPGPQGQAALSTLARAWPIEVGYPFPRPTWSISGRR